MAPDEASRAEFIYAYLGISRWGDHGLVFPDGTRTRIQGPFNITLALLDLREAMAEPGGREAWTWARVWVGKDDLVLHTKLDRNRNCDADDKNRITVHVGLRARLHTHRLHHRAHQHPRTHPLGSPKNQPQLAPGAR